METEEVPSAVDCRLMLAACGSSRWTQDEAWSKERWSDWPWLGISMDQGSDGLISAAFALQNFFPLNSSLFFDFSHDGHNDLQAALRSCHLMDFILLCMVSANLMHGPNKDDARFNQVRACVKKAYSELDESTPLFAAAVPVVADELMREGVTFPEEALLEQEVWDHPQELGHVREKGRPAQSEPLHGSRRCGFKGSVASVEHRLLGEDLPRH